MSKVKIGIVGSGGMGKNRTEAFSQKQQCELVAVASRNVATGNSLAKNKEAMRDLLILSMSDS